MDNFVTWPNGSQNHEMMEQIKHIDYNLTELLKVYNAATNLMQTSHGVAVHSPLDIYCLKSI